MRKNSMTKCAVGAMLFGGTLGATSAANAALVVWNCNLSINQYASPSVYSYGTFVNLETQQFYTETATSPIGTPFSNWNLSFNGNSGSRLVILSRDPAAGIVSPSTSGAGKLASGTTVASALASPFSYVNNGALFTQASNANAWSAGNIGYFGFKFKAASGAIQYGWGELDLNLGSIKEGVITKLVYDDTGAAVTVGAVPAPGALALLGVAGIVGARRRRA